MIKDVSSDKNITLSHFGSLHMLQNVTFINQNHPQTLVNIGVFSITVLLIIFVNSLVLVRLKLKDKAMIDRLITMDSVANLMMVGLLFLAFPLRIWNNRFLCYIITFFRAFTVSINR